MSNEIDPKALEVAQEYITVEEMHDKTCLMIGKYIFQIGVNKGIIEGRATLLQQIMATALHDYAQERVEAWQARLTHAYDLERQSAQEIAGRDKYVVGSLVKHARAETWEKAIQMAKGGT